MFSKEQTATSLRAQADDNRARYEAEAQRIQASVEDRKQVVRARLATLEAEQRDLDRITP